MREHDRLLEELRLLLDALAGKAEEYLRGCEQTPERGEAGCGWCPLCAAMALARGQRPELHDQLLGIVQLLRQALIEHSGTAANETPADEETEPEEPKVQRIQVERVSGPVLAESDAVC
ncbi:hypothetical protein [Saccharopolyspora flava]|uniref:Uncharacterized protein n=1 Tax=Saccharopolyspora flava TaxID=95161 RepID=A0A1I6RSQ0_9PSEU|nr:hypothetical protein [Saccharopolyspora flava]SFS67743.1 hypothetical protein SAMN05660874_02620 [Saccharopolyspora flava]